MRFRVNYLVTGLVIAALAGAAQAQPSGGSVAYGGATISSPNLSTTIIGQTTNSAIINWQSFSLSSGSSVIFNQPNASSLTLNRVLGGGASQIDGAVRANGQVWIINANGILFGKGSQINVAGLLATTSDIADSDFAAGHYDLSVPTANASASVDNAGTIRIAPGGSAVLSGQHVSNQGLIQADGGQIVLGGASAFTLDFDGDNLLRYAVTVPLSHTPTDANGVARKDVVSNSGTLSAAGGRILLTARAAASVADNVVNNSGMISATSASVRNGEVVLDAGEGTVEAGGTIAASGTGAGQSGGTITLAGNSVNVADNTKIDASGDAGGGMISIGGGLHGSGPYKAAQSTSVGNATIHADAITSGNGGTVSLWSAGHTQFAGTITARGGSASGNGGMVETSGETLGIAPNATVGASAAHGTEGTWLLDPLNLTIVAGPASQSPFDGVVSYANPQSEIAAATIENALAKGLNIKLQAVDDITINAAINGTGTGRTLTFDAGRSIFVNANLNMTGNGGTIVLSAHNPAAPGTDPGLATISGTGVISADNITLQLPSNGADGSSIGGAGSYLLIGSGNVSVSTNGANAYLQGSPAPGNPAALALGTVNLASGDLFLKTDSVTQSSSITARNLTIAEAGTGLNGNLTLNSSSNDITGLVTIASSGNVLLKNAVATTLGNVSADGTVTIGSAGDLTIAASSTVSSGAGGDAIVLSAAQNFINNSGSGAVSLTGGGRFLIYSSAPAGDTFGGLDSGNTAVWNETYPTGVSATGNRYVFALHPTLTFTSTSMAKTYGSDATAAVAAAYTITGYQSGVAGAFLADTAATAFTGAPTVTSAGSAAGASVAGSTYQITVGLGTLASPVGYAINLASTGALTVNPAALLITADNQSMTYGGAMPALTASYSGFVNGDTAASLISLPTVVSGTLATANAGIYANTLTASGASAANYIISYAAGTLTINPAALLVTANNQSMTYGGSLPALTVSYSGFVNGDTIGSLTTAPTVVSGTAATANAGTYTNTLTASGAVDGNYVISYAAGTLTINPAALLISANNQSMTYGGTLPALTVSYSGFVNGDTIGSLITAPTVVSGTAATANAGTYTNTLTASGAVDGNYVISYAAGTLTINPAALLISANNQSMTYGSSLPALTVSYSGFVNGDTLASLKSGPTVVSGTAATANVGIYANTLTASGAVDGNYIISYAAGTLTINPAALLITANDQSMTYGGSLPALTVSYSGFVNGDTLASLTSAPTVISGTAATAHAGTYTNSLTASGASAANYTISYVAGTLTINPAALLITANNQSMTYGGAMATLTASFSGFVNGDTAASLTTAPKLVSGTSAKANAGTYANTLTASGALDSNYVITYAAGTLTINPAALLITANNQSMTYGDTMPALSVSYSGFVNGDTAAKLTTAPKVVSGTAATANVGTYTDTLTPGGAVDGNYVISYAAGTLTINPATLTYVADAGNLPLGSAIPTLTGTVTGFVNGDTLESATSGTLTFSTTATAASPVGVYQVTGSGLTALNGNYVFVQDPVNSTALEINDIVPQGPPPELGSVVTTSIETDDSRPSDVPPIDIKQKDPGSNLYVVVGKKGVQDLPNVDTASVSGPIAELTASGASYLEPLTSADRLSGSLSHSFEDGSLFDGNYSSWGNDPLWN